MRPERFASEERFGRDGQLKILNYIVDVAKLVALISYELDRIY
ncbi:hypothetical protein [Novipirellula rosea]|uniref:Uncharacterized protein n=1 Tax=Novipirellula rosea TaxID=1031540 RepID=A0ABP8N379_9BACT